MSNLSWAAGIASALVVIPLGLAVGALALNRVPISAPPGPAARLAFYLSENAVETGDRPRFPELRTPRPEAAPEVVLEQVRAAMERLGWEAVRLDGRRVTAEAVTPLLRFRDDVEVEVRPAAQGSRVHIRSASRMGRADFGANLRHVLDLRAELGWPPPPS